jgi:hypothetical protein
VNPPTGCTQHSDLVAACYPGGPGGEHHEHEHRQEHLGRPDWDMSLKRADPRALLQPAEYLGHARQDHRSRHGTGEAPQASDDQHGQREERQIEEEDIRVDVAQELGEQGTAHTHDERAERERDVALTVRVDADRTRGGLVLTRRAKP